MFLEMVMMAWSVFATCETPRLLTPVDAKTLHKAHTKIYNRIKNQKTTVKIMVAKINRDVVGKEEVIVSFFDKSIKMKYDKGMKVGEIGIGKMAGYTYQDKENFAGLSVTSGALSGLCLYDGKYYSFEPMGMGYIAITLIDQSKFPKD